LILSRTGSRGTSHPSEQRPLAGAPARDLGNKKAKSKGLSRRGLKKQWAYLPVGPLERQFREGVQGGFWEEVPKNPQERVVVLWWENMGKPLLITKIDANPGERLQAF
jgi:hypothetical protein